MKTLMALLGVLISVFVISTEALARDVTYTFSTVQGADSYELQKMEGEGVWGPFRSIAAVDLAPDATIVEFTVPIDPLADIIFYRGCRTNANGQECQLASGAWSCGVCSKPEPPTNLNMMVNPGG